jgi:hypothetical protein
VAVTASAAQHSAGLPQQAPSTAYGLPASSPVLQTAIHLLAGPSKAI